MLITCSFLPLLHASTKSTEPWPNPCVMYKGSGCNKNPGHQFLAQARSQYN
uniref:Uncharacterized protein n=1 Tax=Setaria viridis TaxID=4556 RepID=A0A4U6V3E0_SETVI|nr:hypothetical protein SEVIR_4G168202v2 [Setaria viridis]